MQKLFIVRILFKYNLENEKIDPIVKKFRKFLSQIETKNGADYDQVLYFDPNFVDYDKYHQLVVRNCVFKLIK